MILVVDLGNTRIKWATVASGGELVPGSAVVHRGRTPSDWVPAWLDRVGRPERILVCSVGPPGVIAAIDAQAHARWGLMPEKFVTAVHSCGVRNGYVEPQQLGADRWAALLGVRELDDGAACVVDAGSAVTIDVITGEGTHAGGVIVPGPALMRSAIGAGTVGVPVTGAADRARLEPGRSTRAGLENGILYSLVGFVERFCTDMEAALGQPLARLVTGGDGPALMEHLGDRFRFDGDLVLRGLARFARSTAR